MIINLYSTGDFPTQEVAHSCRAPAAWSMVVASPLLIASTSRAFLVVSTVIVAASSSFAEKTPTAQQWQGELPT
jgi:hypothetical protein